MFKNLEHRMFQLFLVLILFSLASGVVIAAEAPAEQWNSSFGGEAEDSFWCVQQASDGGYVVAGITSSYGRGAEGYPDAWLIKVDQRGNLL